MQSFKNRHLSLCYRVFPLCYQFTLDTNFVSELGISVFFFKETKSIGRYALCLWNATGIVLQGNGTLCCKIKIICLVVNIKSTRSIIVNNICHFLWVQLNKCDQFHLFTKIDIELFLLRMFCIKIRLEEEGSQLVAVH